MNNKYFLAFAIVLLTLFTAICLIVYNQSETKILYSIKSPVQGESANVRLRVYGFSDAYYQVALHKGYYFFGDRVVYSTPVVLPCAISISWNKDGLLEISDAALSFGRSVNHVANGGGVIYIETKDKFTDSTDVPDARWKNCGWSDEGALTSPNASYVQ